MPSTNIVAIFTLCCFTTIIPLIISVQETYRTAFTKIATEAKAEHASVTGHSKAENIISDGSSSWLSKI
jgi:hypothetical protein